MTIESALKAGITRWFPGTTGFENLSRLSGGASQETWSFDVMHPSGRIGVILRRAPMGSGAAPGREAGLEAEAALMQQAFEAGIPSPRVRYVLQPQDGLGSGFVMERVAGETIPRKILRDAQFADARVVLIRQLGKAIAGIHALDQPGNIDEALLQRANVGLNPLQYFECEISRFCGHIGTLHEHLVLSSPTASRRHDRRSWAS